MSALDHIRKLHLPDGARILDVGGGSSVLVDALLRENTSWSITVLDISQSALDHAQTRLGSLAKRVTWVAADITQWIANDPVDLWHDRALLHFLADASDRATYANTLRTALKPGGIALIASFSLNGPEKCSNLPVHRYDAQGMLATLGSGIILKDHWLMHHHTPSDKVQEFQFCLFQRV
ncbi:MAG: class I SAM-dependent methyltransferase [Magnetococcales bacterium]|nr:class I SAM-dependent methyltransferase [Magnetococcales bacterium]